MKVEGIPLFSRVESHALGENKYCFRSLFLWESYSDCFWFCEGFSARYHMDLSVRRHMALSVRIILLASSYLLSVFSQGGSGHILDFLSSGCCSSYKMVSSCLALFNSSCSSIFAILFMIGDFRFLGFFVRVFFI